MNKNYKYNQKAAAMQRNTSTGNFSNKRVAPTGLK